MDYDLDPILTIEEKYEEIQNRYIRSFFKIRFPIEEPPLELTQEYPIENLIENPIVRNEDIINDNNESCMEPKERDDVKKICEVCNGTYSYFNKKRHLTTKKHINALPSLKLLREQTVDSP